MSGIRSDHCFSAWIDQMHLVDVGNESHRLANISRGGGVDPTADLDAVDEEIDHRLHTHRLDHVEARLEGRCAGRNFAAPLPDVLGAQPEDQFAADLRPIPGFPRGRYWERKPIRKPNG